MSTVLSVRLDDDTKKRLEVLARRARRSKSFLAAEAIAAFVEAESWQLDEIQAGLEDLDTGSRQVLVRRYVLGQTAAEIASDTNTSAAGVRMKLKRLRSRLKRLLPKLAGLASLLPFDTNIT